MTGPVAQTNMRELAVDALAHLLCDYKALSSPSHQLNYIYGDIVAMLGALGTHETDVIGLFKRVIKAYEMQVGGNTVMTMFHSDLCKISNEIEHLFSNFYYFTKKNKETGELFILRAPIGNYEDEHDFVFHVSNWNAPDSDFWYDCPIPNRNLLEEYRVHHRVNAIHKNIWKVIDPR